MTTNITVSLSPETHQDLKQLKYLLDSPALSSVIDFLIKQNKNIAPAERITLHPTSISTVEPEMAPTHPLMSITLGNDTHHTLKETKKRLNLKSLDAAVQRYMYATKLYDDHPEKAREELEKELYDLRQELNVSKEEIWGILTVHRARNLVEDPPSNPKPEPKPWYATTPKPPACI